MRRALTLLATVALTVVSLSIPAAADEVPKEFGTDWDDPRTAAKPVERPDTESCKVTLVDHEFDDGEPVAGEYRPPEDCGESWSKVVLRLDGSGSGQQSERMGRLTIGGIPVFKTSTPRPSAEGVHWRQDKDLTGYAALLASKQRTSMRLDDSGDGVLDIRISLTFYATDEQHPPADGADKVLGLTDRQTEGRDLTGKLHTPRNTEKLLADVYATGAGGCEDRWYLAAPAGTGYSCRADSGPYREVQVLIDGELAGLAAPFPNLYAAGWSNPYLWSTLPAPRTFDIRPLTYDLTPYLGLLNDGRSHEVTVRVAGLDPEAEGWSTPTAFRAWRDAGSRVVDGGLLDAQTRTLSNDVSGSGDSKGGKTKVAAEHSHTATGWLSTSHGEVVTSVERTVGNTATHRWGAGERTESLSATWRDDQTRTVSGSDSDVSEHVVEREFTLDGHSSTGEDDRLTSRMDLSDTKRVVDTDSSGGDAKYTVTDRYAGNASYRPDVPPGEARAVADSQQRYRISGDLPCYDHAITTKNGYVTREVDRCGKAVR